MSAQSLLSEVSHTLSTLHVIKSADQAYFKDNQVYTKPQTELSPASTSKQDMKQVKGENQATGAKHADAGDGKNKLKESIKETRNTVEKALAGDAGDVSSSANMDQLQRDVADLKADNQRLHKEITELRQIVQKLTVSGANAHENAAPPKQSEPAKGGDEEFDLFGSDDEEESDQQKKIRDDRLAAYAQKKAKKPGPIAKSTIIYDVKAWDDSTDIGEIEKHVRSIEKDGLVWGNAKVVPIAYGLKKLQICCVIEDEKVSSDLLEEEITSNEDLVQSVDVVAFNKV